MGRSAFDTEKIAWIGVPSSAGARQAGQEQAPQCLRRAGLLEQLRAEGHDVVDLGDLARVSFSPDTQHPRQQNLSRVLEVLEQVRGAVDRAIAERAWPLVVGGDCTITIGVLAALAKTFPRLGLLYLDGDVDLNTPETTHSGIFDGMVLAHILGDGAEGLSHFGERSPLLEERAVTLFGYSAQAGGIDPVEIERLRDTEMAKYPLEEIRGDVRAAATRALRALESEVEHILMHFDVDVVDVGDFPAVDVPHKPGLRLTQVQEALDVFLASRKTVGLVVTEFNAKSDADGTLARQLNDTIRRAIRQRRSSA
ncbi:MAG: arginase family protein [Myxococcales bacterium]|nr:arginase family protein [Myxococcales bacterium]